MYDLDLAPVVSKGRKVGVRSRSHHVVDERNVTRYVLFNNCQNLHEQFQIEEIQIFAFEESDNFHSLVAQSEK